LGGGSHRAENKSGAGSFEEDRESEISAPHQGGDTSPVQTREHAMPSGPATGDTRKVSVQPGGAKRGGYFKERDYEGEK
jgi:hypothetical protein